MTPRFIPGAVYESKTHGLVEFKGIDRYMGQASLRFYSVDHDQTCYWLPTALDFHFGTTQETRPECPSCFGDKTITMSDGSKRPCELCAPLVKVPPVETRACPSCGYQTPILDGVCNVCAERPAPL
jgi:hypothetical protein